MTKFKLDIATDNDAFAENFHAELTRILNEVAARVARRDYTGTVRDSNGNTVGSFRLETELIGAAQFRHDELIGNMVVGAIVRPDRRRPIHRGAPPTERWRITAVNSNWVYAKKVSS